MSKRGFFIVGAGLCLALAGLVLVSGCGGPYKAPPKGFLDDYKRLQPDPKYPGIGWWEKQGVNWKKYTKIMIDPVTILVQPAEHSEYQLKAEELSELARRLRRAAFEAIDGVTPVVLEPGPDVLRLKIALTRAKPISGALNIVTTVFVMSPVDVGQAAVEARFEDALSGEVVMEITASHKGSIMEMDKVWTRWAQVEAAFTYWSQVLRQSIIEAKKADQAKAGAKTK